MRLLLTVTALVCFGICYAGSQVTLQRSRAVIKSHPPVGLIIHEQLNTATSAFEVTTEELLPLNNVRGIRVTWFNKRDIQSSHNVDKATPQGNPN